MTISMNQEKHLEKSALNFYIILTCCLYLFIYQLWHTLVLLTY